MLHGYACVYVHDLKAPKVYMHTYKYDHGEQVQHDRGELFIR